MPRFKHYNYDQDALVVINYEVQLPSGAFEHAVHYLIEQKLDLSMGNPPEGKCRDFPYTGLERQRKDWLWWAGSYYRGSNHL